MTFGKVLKGLNGKVPSNVDAVNMTQNPKLTLKLVRKAQTARAVYLFTSDGTKTRAGHY